MKRLSVQLSIAFIFVTLPLFAASLASIFWADTRMERARLHDAEAERADVRRWTEQARHRLAERARALVQRTNCRPPAQVVEQAPAPWAEIVQLADDRIVASRHLPAGVGLTSPIILPEERSGLAVVMAPGNPPKPALALVAWTPCPGGDAGLWVGEPIEHDSFGAASGRWRVRHPDHPAFFGPSPASGARVDVPTLGPSFAQLEFAAPPGPWPELRTELLGIQGALLALALCIAVGVAVAVGRAVSQPVRELSEAAARVGDGDLDVQVDLRREDELGRLAFEFNDMVRELGRAQDRRARAERLEAWREAAKAVAHEVKNPLFPIRVAVETMNKAIQRGRPDAKEIAKTSTETVLAQVRSIDRLVGEFSDFARLPAPRPRSTPVAAIVDHVVQLHASSHPGRVQARSAPPDERALDPDLLGRALLNLVKNALESAPSSSVWIEAEVSPDEVLFIVEDDGPGIAPEVSDRLFEPYVTDKPTGSGLGLAIVERVALAHGGEVSVRSVPGQTVFSLRIPAVGA